MSETDKLPLIVLAGPTAVGKTALSIRLAKALDGEIISADSMQVYRYMNIGSAKITPREMQGVRHHLIDILDPEEEFNVTVFQKLAKEAVRDICSRGKIPIMTGGTGFYIQSVLYDVDFTENPENSQLRERLSAIAQNKGCGYLHAMLHRADPEAAAQIHENNVKRVIRALDFYLQTGMRISQHNETQRQKQSAYRSCYFVLNDEREKLYNRIDSRVDAMLQAGLIDEVSQLKLRGLDQSCISMQGLGYKEILDYLDKSCDLEQAVYLIKRDTRHFAKRQLTWFKREKDVIWVNRPAFEYAYQTDKGTASGDGAAGTEDRMLQFMMDTINTRAICGRE